MNMLSYVLKTKWLLAVVAASVVGSGVYAFAATLNVSSKSLGAGNAAAASCATAAGTAYTTSYDTTAAGAFRVDTVVLTWTPSAAPCAVGDSLSLVLDGDGAIATSTPLVSITPITLTADEVAAKAVTLTYAATGTPVTGGTERRFGFGTAVSAKLVADVAVAAAGA